ncbi:hypothetical protein [Stenotrophomonas sp. SORGH_AS_0321]|uniref:hypothetical protein n=1 Tax=Stenotrophomonas sp. SORGH_AS_0321 TaxID=3041787 RepID=UPI00285E0A4E|nr:hypothetical protein [Stenotrophomonas sp. SORGH_AS_0321]MDR6096343.1 hypothetical protein [Stenotrophomonas sp. SORGH_AS_0321]
MKCKMWFLLASLFLTLSSQAQVMPVTGLGTCVDFVTSASTTISGQVSVHPAARLYGLPPRYDPVTKNIYVPPYSCESWDVDGIYRTIGYLSHELGHWVVGNPNIAAPLTKAQFTEKMCAWEGAAIRNNGIGRNEVSAFTEGTVIIPLIAVDPSSMLALLGSGATDVQIGKEFCDTNPHSAGMTYTAYYSSYYDANYPW